MKINLTLVIRLLLFCSIEANIMASLKILATAALISNQFEMRKQEYIFGINIIKKYGYEPFIVESCSSSPTFLDELSTNIFYSKSNNFNLKNKGINEAKSIILALDNFNFNDDDIILKITARYKFLNDYFIRSIEADPESDIFIKLDSIGQVFTGCFAMRAKYFKEMFNKLDLEHMERLQINIEYEVAQFINSISTKVKIKKFDNLNLEANIFGTGVTQITYW